MDWNTPDLGSWQARLVTRIGRKLRSNKNLTNEAIAKQYARDAKRRDEQSRHQHRESTDTNPETNEMGERDYSVFSQASTLLNVDNTEMMHGLAHHDSFDSLVDQPSKLSKLRDPYFDSNQDDLEEPRDEQREKTVASLPPDVWVHLTSYLNPADAAHLALASKTLRQKLQSGPHDALRLPENKTHRIVVLQHMDSKMKNHLLCFPCATYHLRTRPGQEMLKADYVLHPVFNCPNTRHAVLPRMRLTHGRELPYSFVQLAVRASKNSPSHGITPKSLERGWKCKDSTWSHRTRYMIHDGRLLLRVVSQAFAPPNLTVTGERHLLYDREEFTPFFSVCPHWRDGELMNVCKCALSHVPAPPKSITQQLRDAPKISRSLARPNFIVTGCDLCAPMRRCPSCPTEYFVDIRMVEDHKDPVHTFKHAIEVTRWSDLGDGSSPYTSPEWAALKGTETAEHYESFNQVGRRAVSGIFESAISGTIPGQRMISLNPKAEDRGEEGNKWY